MSAKILIVDDDVQSLKLIGLMLQRRGYTIVAARDGTQGLAKAESESPDLVILDVMMPDYSGLEVCRRLRSQPQTSHLPIIMFTAKIAVSDKVDGFQSGADDYLTKPIHPDDLAARVEAALLRKRQQAQADRPNGHSLIGFLGVKGGVGTTTLALNIATTLSTPERRVILIDLQTSPANVAAQLNWTSPDGLAHLLRRAPGEITPDRVEASLTTQAHGLRLLLTGPELRASMPSLPAPQIGAILSAAAQLAPVIVLDLGSTLDEATLTILKQCQRIVLVLEPQPLGVTVARSQLVQLTRRSIATERVKAVVVNRMVSASTLDTRSIEDVLKVPVIAVLPPATEVTDAAATSAGQIVQRHPESPIADQLRHLAEHLVK